MLISRTTPLAVLLALFPFCLPAQLPDGCPCRLHTAPAQPLDFMTPATASTTDEMSAPLAPAKPWYVEVAEKIDAPPVSQTSLHDDILPARPMQQQALPAADAAEAAPAAPAEESVSSNSQQERVRKRRRNRRFRPDRRPRQRGYRGRCPRWNRG